MTARQNFERWTVNLQLRNQVVLDIKQSQPWKMGDATNILQFIIRDVQLDEFSALL